VNPKPKDETMSKTLQFNPPINGMAAICGDVTTNPDGSTLSVANWRAGACATTPPPPPPPPAQGIQQTEGYISWGIGQGDQRWSALTLWEHLWGAGTANAHALRLPFPGPLTTASGPSILLNHGQYIAAAFDVPANVPPMFGWFHRGDNPFGPYPIDFGFSSVKGDFSNLLPHDTNSPANLSDIGHWTTDMHNTNPSYCRLAPGRHYANIRFHDDHLTTGSSIVYLGHVRTGH
jgi:hypothetical protein